MAVWWWWARRILVGRTGSWRGRRQYLGCDSHTILKSVFVSSDFVLVQEANRWQLRPMTSQYTGFHGSIWLDRDASCAASLG
jgi:hypothetical protein